MKFALFGFLMTTLLAPAMLLAQSSGAGGAVSVQAKLGKVVIDPGHGGKHPGCVHGKYLEKDITLNIGLELGGLIKKNFPDVEVIYTRTTDKYVDLADRGVIANKANADLFLSIHINSATSTAAHGTSTYVMGVDKSNQNLDVAMKENDVIIYEDDYQTKYEGYTPGDPASYIMFSLMQYAFQDQSMMFADMIQKHFTGDLPMSDRGARQGPFLVLWRTSMPSVLTEVGFLSNADDRAYITSKKGQSAAARSLFNAFSEYKSRVEGRANVVILKEQPDAAIAVTATAESGIKFFVQVAFLSKKQSTGAAAFKSYRGKVTEKRVEGRGYYYLVGGSAAYGDAEALLRDVKREFKDAFIVAYDGDKRMALDQARRKTNGL